MNRGRWHEKKKPYLKGGAQHAAGTIGGKGGGKKGLTGGGEREVGPETEVLNRVEGNREARVTWSTTAKEKKKKTFIDSVRWPGEQGRGKRAVTRSDPNGLRPKSPRHRTSSRETCKGRKKGV